MKLTNKSTFILLISLGFFSVKNLLAVSFDKRWIQLGSKKIQVEIADRRPKREKGLMGRMKPLKKNEGMLFVFSYEKTLSFWMKNTYIPLSIGYFNKKKKLIDIQNMNPISMLQIKIPSFKSKAPAMYALEMNQGWFRKNYIKVGMTFKYINKKKISKEKTKN